MLASMKTCSCTTQMRTHTYVNILQARDAHTYVHACMLILANKLSGKTLYADFRTQICEANVSMLIWSTNLAIICVHIVCAHTSVKHSCGVVVLLVGVAVMCLGWSWEVLGRALGAILDWVLLGCLENCDRCRRFVGVLSLIG